ncbi:MAG: phage tail tape measure protein [Gemmatimonadaceae bacterium]|jgi:phage-related minor tail protein
MPTYKVGIDVTANDKASGPLGKVDKAADALGGAFGDGAKDINAFGVSLGDLINPTTLVAGAVTALGAAAVATAAQAMDLASQVDQSTAKMSTQLNLTTEEAAGFESVMRNIYEANYGDSFEDISLALTETERAFARVGGTETQAQLEAVTIKALSLRDAFDTDVNGSVNAAVTLMENFGITSDQAFDLITAGYQKGLDSSGDFLDTIGEYSVQFAQGGADAGQFFSILESGMQGGMLGTDKAADAFKEFTIRIGDGSTTTNDALETIGISYETLRAGFADGSITTVDAMQMVIEKINEIEDPIQRNIVGVALFGTQWEDLTATVVLAIDAQKTKLGELEGASASLEKQYDTDQAKIEAANRQWENALVDIGKEFNALKVEAIPGIAWAVETLLVPAIQTLAEFIRLVREGQSLSLGTLFGASLSVGIRNAQAATPDLAVVNPQNTVRAQTVSQSETTVVVNVERGDPAVVTDATELGVRKAQQMRGE